MYAAKHTVAHTGRRYATDARISRSLKIAL
jgi:hypothetical protein